jgi:hypothetical protein
MAGEEWAFYVFSFPSYVTCLKWNTVTNIQMPVHEWSWIVVVIIWGMKFIQYLWNSWQYENRSYILSEFSDQTWSFIRHGKLGPSSGTANLVLHQARQTVAVPDEGPSLVSIYDLFSYCLLFVSYFRCLVLYITIWNSWCINLYWHHYGFI